MVQMKFKAKVTNCCQTKSFLRKLDDPRINWVPVATTVNDELMLLFWFGFFCLMAYQPSWLFTAKATLHESYLTHSWEDKEVHIFPKGIYPKVNIIARLEFELAYYDVAVQCFNNYTKRTPTQLLFWKE